MLAKRKMPDLAPLIFIATMPPEETIAKHREQSRARLRWFVIACATGSISAFLFWLFTDTDYSPWNAWLVGWGFVFIPAIITISLRKDLVSTREAMKARRELASSEPSEARR